MVCEFYEDHNRICVYTREDCPYHWDFRKYEKCELRNREIDKTKTQPIKRKDLKSRIELLEDGNTHR